MVGVEHCAEGHPLQTSTADIRGRCEGCKRWVFGKEKVMSCGTCGCYYCSVCAPQVLSGADDHLWDDFLSTVGNALRDAERIKDQISNEIDMTRIRSAFNCQEPGVATLSAEQIFVEHAVEQVRSSLNCANPDISDLRSQEEVIDRDIVTPAHEEDYASAAAEPPADQPVVIADQPPVDLVDLSTEVQHVPADQPTVIAELPPVDLLDLSAQVQHVPAAEEKPGEQALVDLLDITVDEDVKPQAAEEVKAPADLLDMQAPVQLADSAVEKSLGEESTAQEARTEKAAPQESAQDKLNALLASRAAENASPECAIIANSAEKVPMDLFDLSAVPVSKDAKEVAPDYQNLVHLSQSLVAPEANVAVAQAALEAGPPDLL